LNRVGTADPVGGCRRDVHGRASEPPEAASKNSSDLPSLWKVPVKIGDGLVGWGKGVSEVLCFGSFLANTRRTPHHSSVKINANVVETRYGADLAALGTRKARKTAKNLFHDGLPDATARIEIAIKAAFGPKAAEVQQAFPSGRSLFSSSPDDLLGAAIGVMNSVVAANSASLPPATVTLSAGLVTGWAAVYTESEAASAVKNHSVAEKRAARKALQRELYLTLVHLMVTYPLQPEKLEQYMKQHLLEDHLSSPDDEEDDDEGDEPDPPVEE